MTRLGRRLAALALALTGLCAGATLALAQTAGTGRLIVQLREPTARDLQRALARRAPSSLGRAAPAALEAGAGGAAHRLLRRHGAVRMRPVHAALLREMNLSGLSARRLAERKRARFTRRARRSAPLETLPDLASTYAIELEGEPDDAALEAALASLRSDPEVQYAHRERVYRALLAPNDPEYQRGNLYGLEIIRAEAAWDVSLGEGVVVAVVDSGIDPAHPDIDANIWQSPGEIAGNGRDDDRNGFVDDTWGWNFAYDTRDPWDDDGHGTHVAGTIAAEGNNGLGVIGVAPAARVLAVKVLDDLGAGTSTQIAAGIRYAADQGADVINLSLGGEGPDPTLLAAVRYAQRQGAVVVAAAGNEGADVSTSVPAAFPEVIAVAASDARDQIWRFSNFGAGIDIAAPGVGIRSLFGRSYQSWDGTSMASPHVAGAAALILSAFPGSTHEDVRALLHRSADDLGAPGRDDAFGFGRLNVQRALDPFRRIAVNFQSPRARLPYGYLMDAGEVFADRGNGYAYGWSERNRGGVDRNSRFSPDQRYDTANRVQIGARRPLWEIAVPDGRYGIRVVAGDAGRVNAVHRLDAEGVRIVEGAASRDERWFEGTAEVVVEDGRLTLSSAKGARNSALAFVEIELGEELLADGDPPQISGVQSEPLAHSALVRWSTDEQSTSQVEYGPTAAYGSVTPIDPSLVTEHVVALEGLQETTPYFYRVISRDLLGNVAVSPTQSFTTPDGTPPDVRLLSPPSGRVRFDAEPLRLVAEATDAVGVQSVQMFVDGEELGAPLLDPPYVLSWDPAAATDGLHELRARARDAQGNEAVSEPVYVTLQRSGELQISFQPARAAAPPGFFVDSGEAFGERESGLRYGWERRNRAAVARRAARAPASERDSFIRMRRGRRTHWDVELPAGLYQIEIGVGDARAARGTYQVQAEGVTVVEGSATRQQRRFEGTALVRVDDGALTLTNGPDARVNKISYVRIRSMGE